MMYQSMSGDAASGTSAFIMSGGTLTSKNGHVFHVTNTHAVINLFGVQIINEDTSDILLSVCDDGWSGGVNDATLNADGQQLTGTILVGNNSQFTLNLDRNSSFEGSFSGNIENVSGEIVSSEIGEVSVKIDGDSTWKLTGDSYISEFEGDIASVDFNGHTLYVNGEVIS
jgi:predicted RNA-binding protein